MTPTTRQCPECGTEFIPGYRSPSQKPQQYCTNDCAKRHHGPKPKPWQERFWRHLTPGHPDECWEWQGMRHQQGYGRLATTGRDVIPAHRASFILHNGPIADGLHVLHACDNPPCCNPAHLSLGTHAENMVDMARKGRSGVRTGTANNKATLTWEEVCEIRRLRADGEPLARVAQQFGIAPSTVSAIALYRSRVAS